jgi:putative molybdopterin biosynthesis protein
MYNGECDVVIVHLYDVGVGIESVAKMVNMDFIPLIKEHYDLVKVIKEAVTSSKYRSQLEQLNGYDLKITGKIMYES